MRSPTDISDEKHLKSELKIQQNLASIGRLFANALDVDRVWPEIADVIGQIVGFDRLVICKLSSDRRQSAGLYISGVAVKSSVSKRYHAVGNESIIRRLGKLEAPLLFSTAELEILATTHRHEAYRWRSGLRSLLAVPLNWRGELIGSLNLRSFGVDAYDHRDIHLAEQIGAQFTGAIVALSIHEEAQQKTAQRSALSEIGRAASENLKLDEVFKTFADEFSSIIPYDRFTITRLDSRLNGLKEIILVRGIAIPGSELGVERWEHLSRPGRSATIENITSESIHPIDRSVFGAGLKSRMRGLIGTPDNPLGSVAVLSKRENAFNRDDATLLDEICTLVLPAVRNAQNHEALIRLAAEQQTLAEISQAVNENLDLNILYSRLADSLSEVISFDRFEVSEIELESDGRQIITVRHSTGIEIDGLTVGSRWLASDPKHTGPQFELNVAIVLPVEIDPHWARELISAGIKSRMRAVIGFGDEPLIAITVLSRDVDAYNQNHADLLSRICKQIAPAIENANKHDALLRLADSFEQAQQALDSTSDMVAIHDVDTKYIYVNDAFLAGTGYDREDIIGLYPPIQVAEQRNESIECWSTARAGKVWSGTYPAYRKDMTMYREQSTLSPVFDDHNEISSFVAVKRDVTDLLEAADLISQSRAREDLISTVLHELGSPLTAVINFVDVLQKSGRHRPEIVEALKTSTTELTKTINDLKRVNVDSVAQLIAEIRPENISVLLRNSIARSSLLVEKKQLNLTVSISNDPMVVELEIDAARMSQVFSNLITNAVRYTPNGSNVEVSLDQSGRFTRFRIYNENSGVAASELDMVTHPFFRGASSIKSTDSGSGIGLALSSAIVHAHGGYMSIRSEPEQFFEVEVLLPNPRLN